MREDIGSVDGVQARQWTWMSGGLGLITSGVVGIMWFAVPELLPLAWARAASGAVFAASVLLLAVGRSRDSSVVLRRPLGMVAMTVLAVWSVFGGVRGLISGAAATQDLLVVLDNVSLFISTGAALVAAIEIARARTVPAPWRWAPSFALALQVVLWALPQIVVTSIRHEDVQAAASFLVLCSNLSLLVGTVGLGVVAVYLAASQRLQTIQIYRSS